MRETEVNKKISHQETQTGRGAMQEKIQGSEEERGQGDGVWVEQRDKVSQTVVRRGLPGVTFELRPE